MIPDETNEYLDGGPRGKKRVWVYCCSQEMSVSLFFRSIKWHKSRSSTYVRHHLCCQRTSPSGRLETAASLIATLGFYLVEALE